MMRLSAAWIAIAVVTTPASAEAAVTSAQRVSPQGFLAQQGFVAAGGGRTAVAMIGRTGTGANAASSLQVRVGQGSHLGQAQRLARGYPIGTALAVGPDGTAAAAWGGSPLDVASPARSIRVAVAPRNGRFGPARTLVTASPVTLDGVAVTATGAIVVVYRTGTIDTSRPVQAVIAPPGGTFGPPTTLGVSRQYAPTLTTIPNGRVLVAWLDTPAAPPPPPAPYVPTNARLMATTLDPEASSFAPSTELGSLTSWGPTGPAATSSPVGGAVSWPQTGGQRIATVSTDGRFAPTFVAPVEGPTARIGVGLQPDRTVDVLHRAARYASPESERIVSSWIEGTVRVAETGAFTPLVTISRSNRLVGPPQMVSLRRRTFAAWTQRTPAGRGRVEFVTRAAGTNWRSLGELTAPAVRDTSLRVGASTRYAAVTWIQITDAKNNGGDLYLSTYRP